MNADHEIIEKIDAYLLGNVTPEERKAFEAEVLKNPELAETLRLQLQGRYAARADAKTDLKHRFDAEFDQLKQERTGKRVNMRRMLMAAAAAILLLIAVPWLVKSFSEPETFSAEELYTMHFQPAHMNVRGAETQSQVWQEAIQAYLNKNYPQASIGFEKALADTAFKRVSEAWLYLGVSALELKQPIVALSYFDKVDPDSYYHSDAQWYQALAYLNMKEPSKAKPILMKIAENERNSRSGKAKDILKKISE